MFVWGEVPLSLFLCSSAPGDLFILSFYFFYLFMSDVIPLANRKVGFSSKRSDNSVIVGDTGK